MEDDPVAVSTEWISFVIEHIEQAAQLSPEALRAGWVDAGGVTLLMHAAAEGRVAVAEHLIDLGAPVGLRSPEGYTALSLAAMNGQGASVDALLRAGADVNDVDAEGSTPLMLAVVRAGRVGVVSRLLAADGCQLDVQDVDGRTALWLACEIDEVETARLLLEAGADPTLVDHEGVPPEAIAGQGCRRVLLVSLCMCFLRVLVCVGVSICCVSSCILHSHGRAGLPPS
jgi:ankyrin repeat protein